MEIPPYWIIIALLSARLSAPAEVFESLVNEQLERYLSINNILSQTQSGFRQGHDTITAAMSVTNDIITALDDKKKNNHVFHFILIY